MGNRGRQQQRWRGGNAAVLTERVRLNACLRAYNKARRGERERQQQETARWRGSGEPGRTAAGAVALQQAAAGRHPGGVDVWCGCAVLLLACSTHRIYPLDGDINAILSDI